MPREPESPERPLRVLLVGAFRSIVPEVLEGGLGAQGGFVDTLAPSPYSLATATLQAYAQADPAVRRATVIERLDLAEPLELEDAREEVALSARDLDALAAHEPDLVALSAYCWNLDALREAAAELKQRRPGCVVVLGGRSAHGEPEALLRSSPALDAVVVGEGEIPFREVLRRRGRGLAGIPGVFHRDGDRIRSGGPPAVVEDLDEIPSPYLEGLLDPPPNALMLQLGRGCPNECGYCTWSADRRLRWFSPARVEAEVRWALAAGHRHATVDDAALGYEPARLAEAVAAIRRADPAGALRLTYNLRHETVGPAVLESVAALPTHMVLLGVETFSAPAMAEAGRPPVDRAALRAVLEAVARAARPPVVSIVLGLPGDTEEGFRETLETLLAWSEPVASGAPPAVGTVLVSLLQVYPGSGLWERRQALGLRFAERGIPYLVESRSWSREALARAKAELVRRMAARGDVLKAAEAIALLEPGGGLDPWLRTGRALEVLGWPIGASREGFTLEAAGLARDTGAGVLLRFRAEDGRAVRVLLGRPEQARARPHDSRRYSPRLRVGPGEARPDELALLATLHEALLGGEARLAARANRRR